MDKKKSGEVTSPHEDNQDERLSNTRSNEDMREALLQPAKVSLQRSSGQPTDDQALWVAIRNRTQAIGFDRYQRFINSVLCADSSNAATKEELSYGSPPLGNVRDNLRSRPTIHGVDAYNLLKQATEAFLIFECGVVIDNHDSFDESVESRRLGQPVDFSELTDKLGSYLGAGQSLPYLDRIVKQIVGLDAGRRAERMPYCESILQNRLSCPSLLELIWSYWHEQGMLVQTINALALRFQNRRSFERDPLINLELDPLRPLNNLLWGFVQDENNRLSVERRAYEYDHHYGLTLQGKAIRNFRPVDSRSKFLEAFHNLLYRAAMFYRDDDDTTIIADAFSLLNALREVHLILAEAAHNQFGDLPWTARREMLIMQWLLSRSEIREFLRGRHMVPYQETWMGAVDDMRRLQGWGDVTITHFHELAKYGEQIILSVRYGDWININDQEHARNWARYWRPEIQRYIHAYMAATGVDLSTEIIDNRQVTERYLQPSLHLQRRLAVQSQQNTLLTGVASSRVVSSEVSGYAELPYHSGRRLLRHGRDE